MVLNLVIAATIDHAFASRSACFAQIRQTGTMLSPHVLALVLGHATLNFVAVATIPAGNAATSRLGLHRRNPQAINGVYRDEDGEATEESTSAFLSTSRRGAILLASFVGFIASLTSAVSTTIQTTGSLVIEYWFRLGIWVMIYNNFFGD